MFAVTDFSASKRWKEAVLVFEHFENA